MLRNIFANFLGRFWGFLSAFLFTPLYIKFLGVEAYSIISFSLVLSGFMFVLGAGLSTTLTREFALKTNSSTDKVNTLKTFELFYYFISIVVLLLFFAFSEFISHNWLKLDKVSPEEVTFYLKIMGFGISFQLLCEFYIGGFMGLEKQIKANTYQIVWGVFRNGIVIIPIYFFPSLKFFFIWQSIITIIYALVLRYNLTKELKVKIPIFRKPIFDKSVLNNTWKFAAGIFFVSLVASFNTQMDKLAISKLLPINILGYYTLAISLAQSIILLVNPISTAVMPRISSLFSQDEYKKVKELYEKMTLLISILVFSFGLNILFNGKNLIWIWTNNLVLANNSSIFIPILSVGMIVYSFQILPFNLAIANAYTKLNNFLGILSLIVTLPGYWIMTNIYGAIGAAITWCIVQSIITIVYVYYIHKKFLPDIIQLKFLLNNYIKPFIIILIITYLFNQFTNFSTNRFGQFFWIGLSTIISILVTIFSFFTKKDFEKYITKVK
jgi:O-antigen/teichoic acid export membrane protein